VFALPAGIGAKALATAKTARRVAKTFIIVRNSKVIFTNEKGEGILWKYYGDNAQYDVMMLFLMWIGIYVNSKRKKVS
jgi:hypothetical protein